MGEINTKATPIVPETPKVSDVEKFLAYIPTATHRTAGIAKFDGQSFYFKDDGTVALRVNTDDLSKTIVDIKMDKLTGEGIVSYADGTTVSISFPVVKPGDEIVNNVVRTVTFLKNSWTYSIEQDLYELRIKDLIDDVQGEEFSEQSKGSIVTNVERAVTDTDGNIIGYESTALSIVKSLDGSLSITSSETFDGRILFVDGLYYVKKNLITDVELDEAVDEAVKALTNKFTLDLSTVKQDLTAEIDAVESEVSDIFDFNNIVTNKIEALEITTENLASKNIEIQRDIKDLYLLSNATVTGTEELTQEYSERQTADGLSGLIDGALTRVTKVQGNTVKSANIFDRYAYTAGISESSAIAEITDEKVVVRVTVDGTYKSGRIPIKNPEQYIGKTLYVSAKWTCSASNLGAIRVSWVVGTTLNNSMMTVDNPNNGEIKSGVVPAPPEGYTGLYVYLYSNSTGTGVKGDTVTYTDIMVSTENVPYQPYFDGLKNSYFKGVRSTGKNLFDALGETTTTATKFNYAVGSITNNNVAGGATDKVLYSKIYPAGTYTISGLAKSTSQDNATDSQISVLIMCDSKPSGFEYVDYYKGYVANMDSGVKKSFTTTKPFTIGFRFSGTANSKKTYSDIMLQYGSTDIATEYEPYKADESFMLDNAVELGLGVTIDIQNKKIIDNSKIIVLTGEEDWRSGSTYINKYSSLVCYNILPTSQTRANGVATEGRVAKRTNDSQEYGYGVWWCGVNNNELYILSAEQYFNFTQFANPNNPTTEEKATLLAEWKAYLAQQYANGNPVTIRYVSTTGTETDIAIPTDKYQAWVGGSETQVQGDINNSKYGANNTITQTYAVIKGGAEQ